MAFIKRRTKRFVAIDWDSRTLRVVVAQTSSSGVKIDRLLTSAIPADLDQGDAAQMGGHIRRTLDQEGISVKHAIVDIPRDQAILKTLTLPTAHPEALPGMVAIQIAKELPFPVSEAAVDFTTEGTSNESPTGEVLVAAVRREVLDTYAAILDAAGLKLDRVGLRPYANKVAVTELLKHAMPERVLFIDVRPTFMEIDVIKHSAMAFSRSASVTIPPGGGASPVLSIGDTPASPEFPRAVDSGGTVEEAIPPGGVLPSLLMEVTRSIEAYRAGDPGAQIDHVVIGGDTGVEEPLSDVIQSRLGITTELYNPASTFGWEPDEGAAASSFAASLGLVLSQQDQSMAHFDFLHPKKSVSIAQERLKKAPLVAAAVAVFVLLSSVGLASITRPSREKLASIETAISKLQKKQRSNKKFLSVLREIERFDSRQHVWVDVLYDVMAVLPSNQEIVLNHIELKQKQGRITLKTRGKSRDTAIRAIDALEAFRREDRELPRFAVSLGTQTEKKGEKYPFFQDLRVRILDDTKKSKKRSGKSKNG